MFKYKRGTEEKEHKCFDNVEKNEMKKAHTQTEREQNKDERKKTHF